MVGFSTDYEADFFKRQALADLIDQVHALENPRRACQALDDFLSANGFALLSVKFTDARDDTDVLRTFSNYPQALQTIGRELTLSGGCPFARESKRLLRPFGSSEIERKKYSSFMEQRFFNELEKLNHQEIAVLPTMMRRGIAMLTVGLGPNRFTGETREAISNAVNQFLVAVMEQFPEVNDYFSRRHLSETERNFVQLLAYGKNINDISGLYGVSEFTVRQYLSNAAGKLGVRSNFNLVCRALFLREIFEVPAYPENQ